MEKQWKQWQTLFPQAPKSHWMVTAAMKLKDACSLGKSNGKPRQHIKKQRHYFANKVLCSQSCGFSSGYVRMWELDNKKAWVLKNWCFWNVVLEKTLEIPLDSREIKSVNPKGNQPWIFIERTDAEAEVPIFWPPDTRNWLIKKHPDAWKDWRQEEKGKTKGWDGWMALPTRQTCIWANSGSWWWTGEPGMLQSMGSPRVRHNWVTELNWRRSQRKGWKDMPPTCISLS